MSEEATHPFRLVSFVSQEQLDSAKKTRGERIEDGTAQRDRPLFEILKENKDKRDAEFNERFKHRPPKALDEDETEFLDKLETSRREYEQQVAAEEAQQLQNFQAAVAARATMVHEIKEMPPVSEVQTQQEKVATRKNAPVRPSVVIKVKPQAKKAKVDVAGSKKLEALDSVETSADADRKLCTGAVKLDDNNIKSHNVTTTSLVSYSDGSEDDD